MTKSLNSFWRKSIKRLGKIQQAQSKRLFKSLLTQVFRVKPVRRAKPVKPVKALVTKAAKLSRKPLKAPARSVSALPGSWQTAYFSPSGSAHIAAGRRMLYWLYLPAVTQVRPAHHCHWWSCCTDASKRRRIGARLERR